MQRLEFLYLSGNNLDYIPTPLPLSLRVLHLQVPLYTHTYIHGLHLHLWFPNVCSAPFWRGGGSTVPPPPKLTCSQLLLQNCNLSKKKRKKNSQITRGPDPYFGNHWSTWTENFQNFCRQIIASVGHMVEEAGLMPDSQKVSGSMSSFLCVMTLKDEELVDKCICLNCLTKPFQHLCVCLF